MNGRDSSLVTAGGTPPTPADFLNESRREMRRWILTYLSHSAPTTRPTIEPTSYHPGQHARSGDAGTACAPAIAEPVAPCCDDQEQTSRAPVERADAARGTASFTTSPHGAAPETNSHAGARGASVDDQPHSARSNTPAGHKPYSLRSRGAERHTAPGTTGRASVPETKEARRGDDSRRTLERLNTFILGLVSRKVKPPTPKPGATPRPCPLCGGVVFPEREVK